MSEITKSIRTILANWVNAIDAGNTNIPEDQEKQLLDVLCTIASPYISTYTAQQLLKKATKKEKATFYNMIKDGRLPKGEHVQGFKETHFNKYKVEKAIKELDSKSN